MRLSRQGRLQYYRRVPQEKRHLFGGRGSFTAVLDCDPSKPTSKAAQEAWSAANEAYEQQLAGDSQADSSKWPIERSETPLSPRDAAGIAAEPLRRLMDAGDSGQITRENEDLLATVALIAEQAAAKVLNGADLNAGEAAKTKITLEIVGPLLNQLNISPDSTGVAQIQKRLLQYLQVMGKDLAKREAGDFSPSELETIAPPVPKTQLTYEQLLDQWRTDAGGLVEEGGIGVGQKRMRLYQRVIKEIIEITGKHFPGELTVADARNYTNQIQQADYAIRTKTQRISMVSNLFSIGVRFGLLDMNPFTDMRIKMPKNIRIDGYRSFTRDELQIIVDALNIDRQQEKAMITKALLCTGARCSDLADIRHQDIKQTKEGVWFFDLVHEPSSKHPHPLKGGHSDERCTPMHPWLVKQGFLKYVKPGAEGYVFPDHSSNALSGWFRRLLIKFDIYEKDRTVLHSLRGTFIDLMREARVSQDIRRAMTGHSSRDVQDKSYGEGLAQMPAVLHKELQKVDLDWLQ